MKRSPPAKHRNLGTAKTQPVLPCSVMTLRSVITLLLLLALAVAPVHADPSADARKLKRIEREMRDKKQQLKRANRRERSILSELERIERESQSQGRELEEQQQKLRDAETALAELVRQSDGLRRETAQLAPRFATRLRSIYKLRRSGGYALAVLSADDPASFTRRSRLFSALAERDSRLLAEYGTALARLDASRRAAADRQAAIRTASTAAAAKRRQLDAQRRKKTALLASVKQRKSVYEETLEDLEESSQELWATIREAERRKKDDRARPPAAPQARGAFPWPAKGAVLTRFGKQRHPQFGTIVYRRGIEIAARIGDEVRSIAAGQVMYADWVKGYGQLVILDHGAGLYTLYGHLSAIAVQQDERVAAGQAIGAAGDTGSLAGPRLYFELRRNGEAQDPLAWLAKR